MKIITYLWLLVICFLAVWYQGQWDFFHHKWAALMMLGAFFYSIKIGKHTNFLWGALGFYGLLSAIIVCQWHANPYYYHEVKEQARLFLGYYSGLFIAFFVLLTGIIIYIKEHIGLSNFKSFWVLLCFVDSVYVLTQWAIGNEFLWRGGFFANGSINGCFIAFTYPFYYEYVLKRLQNKPTTKNLILAPIFYVIPIAAILCSLTSVSVGTLAVAIAALCFFSARELSAKLMVPIFLAGAIIAIGYTVDPAHFFSDSGRFKIYEIVWSDWFGGDYDVTGTGSGTFPVIGMASQIMHNHRLGEWHVWLHSDWLQLLIELGYVGASLVVLCSISLVVRAWKEPYLISAILAFMASMLFNYPCHYPLHVLFALFIIAFTYEKS